MRPKQTLILTIGVLLLAGGGAWYFLSGKGLGAPGPAATTSSMLPEGATITEEELSTEAPAIPAPNYRAVLKINTSVSADVRAALLAQHEQTIKILSTDPNNFNIWLNLAILRKTGGDYRGAEEVWLYTSKQWPTSPISFNNLADLYQNFLNEPAKAQAAANKAAALQAAADAQ